MNALTDTQRWRAVCERNVSLDGAFVFAVRTTGIYCRPGCSARRPKRENVVFYDDAAAAEAAGYRGCKRCRPGEDQPPHLQAITKAAQRLRSVEEEPPLAELAAQAGLSAGHFQRVFKKHLGLSPKDYARAARKQRLRDNLGGGASVTDAIYAAGYGSASRAYADGTRLRLYRRGAKGETLFYATAATTLGEIVVALSEQGVCQVEFLDSREPEAAVRERFAFARLQPAGRESARWLREVVARIDSPNSNTDALPLDIRGTAFQEQVWRALMQIPRGETRSYGELAKSLGRPKASRAIGTACAANPVAVVIPCHRVVGAKDALTGYRWGVERKRALLKRESES